MIVHTRERKGKKGFSFRGTSHLQAIHLGKPVEVVLHLAGDDAELLTDGWPECGVVLVQADGGPGGGGVKVRQGE